MDPPALSHSTTAPATILIGIGVLVVSEEGRIYFRQGRDGSLALPAGHLNMFEDWKDATKRIAKEEMNIDLTGIQFAHVTNDPLVSQKSHYVSIFMSSRLDSPKIVPENTRPENFEGWKTYSWEELRDLCQTKKLFGPLANLVRDDPPAVQEFLHPTGSSPSSKTTARNRTAQTTSSLTTAGTHSITARRKTDSSLLVLKILLAAAFVTTLVLMAILVIMVESSEC